MAKINIKIEGVPYQVEEGLTILEAAKACGYEIPSLCAFNHGECSVGSCRVCLVEATGARGLVASCVYPVNEGMEIRISTPKAVAARRASVELILSNHNKNCQQCVKNGKCELLHVASLTGAREGRFAGSKTATSYDAVSPSIIRDTSKCVLCGRCIQRCANAHGMGILGFENRGFHTIVAPAENRSFVDSPCILCGQCVSVCPTGALTEKSEIEKVDEAMKSGKHVVVQTAPAVRAALGEEFGYPVGTPVTGKMVAALRRLGFEKVYDTDFGADLTIMEEGTELLSRIQNGGVLPMITSCSPGWVNYAEYNYGDLLDHLSSCKSPHQMQGAIIKSYYAEKNGIDPKDIFVVSVMPCTAKKFEKEREEMNVDGIRDVDAVITTRELARMIKRSGIIFNRLPDEEYDADIMGDYTGAGVIFGVTGGVTEAVLRRLSTDKSNKALMSIAFNDVRGMKGVKETTIPYGDKEVRIAIVSGLKNAESVIQALKNGEHFDFIEVMACPGGCVAGGGQPFGTNATKEVRGKALYSADKMLSIKRSEENPLMLSLYDGVLKGRVHELLHVHYNHKEEE